jgi:hypothetical protein
MVDSLPMSNDAVQQGQQFGHYDDVGLVDHRAQIIITDSIRKTIATHTYRTYGMLLSILQRLNERDDTPYLCTTVDFGLQP